MAWALVGMALGSLSTLLLVRWRRARRSALPPTPAPLFFTPERIAVAAQHLSMQLRDDSTTPAHELPHHGVPDGFQWMQLLVSQPQLAHRLIHQLYLRAYTHGLAATETVTILSIVAYHAAHVVMTQRDPATLPQPQTWDTYPTPDQWEQIVHTDAHRAAQLVGELELRAAQFGSLHAPIMLSESIKVGSRMIHNGRSSGEDDGNTSR
jgi:hypothetical protein